MSNFSLLYSTHIREQIFYQAETLLRSLVEYNIRSECEFEKNYRQGRFGAVPIITS